MIWLRKSWPFCLSQCWFSTSIVAKSCSSSQNTTTKHNTQHTQQPTWAAPPYSQRLCPLSPWQHPPRTQITAPRLPMSPMQASGVAGSLTPLLFPCMGCQNGTHQKKREGRDLNLRWLPLDGGIQQSTEGRHRQRVIGGGGNGALGNNKGVGHFPIIWGVKQAIENLK
jgi:hypothetical protein